MIRTVISILSILLLFSCNQSVPKDNKPEISVSIPPQQYFIERIAGNMVEVNVMIPPGASPATYEPTVSQLSKLDRTTLYLKIGYIGFELGWFEKIRSVNPDMKVVDLSAGIELIHEADEHQVHGRTHGGVDPHIWMSPVNARIIARNVYNELLLLLPGKEEILTTRFNKLDKGLDSLNQSIGALLRENSTRSFMIYHPALSYFARDFNLIQLSLETGGKTPSPAQMKKMADLGRENGISAIFIQQQFDRKNAESLAREIDADIVQINPMDPDWFGQMMYIAKQLQLTL